VDPDGPGTQRPRTVSLSHSARGGAEPQKLGTDRIDIYYLHNVDPETEPEETLRTMEDLVRQGKVRYVGASNYRASQVIELLWTADRLGLEPVACLQNQYSLLHR
jgi:aryl-alcohol dehydrogenase-like predicted oxidoreductase